RRAGDRRRGAGGPAACNGHRNCPGPALTVVTDTSDWLRLWERPALEAAMTLGKRALFVFGFTPPIKPERRVRPHWMILWFRWATYPPVKVRRGQPLEFRDLLVYAHVVGCVVPILFVAADIASYGGRMVVAILPLLLIPAVRLFFANPSDVTHVRH